MLSPTASNRQNFFFTFSHGEVEVKVKSSAHSKIDFGIVKYHFEIGTGKEKFFRS